MDIAHVFGRCPRAGRLRHPCRRWQDRRCQVKRDRIPRGGGLGGMYPMRSQGAARVPCSLGCYTSWRWSCSLRHEDVISQLELAVIEYARNVLGIQTAHSVALAAPAPCLCVLAPRFVYRAYLTSLITFGTHCAGGTPGGLPHAPGHFHARRVAHAGTQLSTHARPTGTATRGCGTSRRALRPAA
eukprot:scaffold79414_cov30-Tisochrysis_lutea.AAC.2